MLRNESALVKLSLVRLRPAAGYTLAVLASIVTGLARHALDPYLPAGFPYVTFFPAVILVSFFAGRGPAILCAFLCGLIAWYWFIPPFAAFGLDVPTAYALGLYVFIVGINIAVIDAMQRTALKLAREREVNAALGEEQRTLFQELQHRVANNLMFVASMLSMSKRRIAADPAQASVLLDDARARIEVMSKIHRQLYDPQAGDRDFAETINSLCNDFLAAAGAERVRVECTIAPLKLTLDHEITLSLLLAELMTNCLKHGFADGRAGRIHVDIHAEDRTTAVLIVRDDGAGFVASPDAARSANGLGQMIMQSLAAKLGGHLAVSSAPGEGTLARVTFPLN